MKNQFAWRNVALAIFAAGIFAGATLLSGGSCGGGGSYSTSVPSPR